jgi:hypothetical protein
MFFNFEIKKMKESIIKALNYHYDISITALKNRVEGGEGNSNFFFSTPKGDSLNLLLVSGVSESFVSSFNELLSQKIISIYPTNLDVVGWDGGEIYDLPIPKKINKNKPFKKTHWFPVLVKQGENFPKS